jgi:hypothetical protein
MGGCGNVRAYFFLYINICKNIYIYVHHIHAIKKFIKGEGTVGGVALGCKDARWTKCQAHEPAPPHIAILGLDQMPP